MTASSGPKRASNIPALASKQDGYIIASSASWKDAIIRACVARTRFYTFCQSNKVEAKVGAKRKQDLQLKQCAVCFLVGEWTDRFR